MNAIPLSFWQRWLATSPEDRNLCVHAVSKLGCAAAWLLRPDVLQSGLSPQGHADAFWNAALERPWSLFRSKPGATWILFAAHEGEGRSSGLFREAFFLPLLWKPDQEHSTLLPLELRELADQVLEALRKDLQPSSPGAVPSWGLHFQADVWGDTSLAEIRLACHSAFASLATSLWMAHEQLLPKPFVFVSAVWNATQRRLERAARLATKWQAIQAFWLDKSSEAFSSQGSPLFFVTDEAAQAEIEQAGVPKSYLRCLQWRSEKLLDSLQPALFEMQERPTLPRERIDDLDSLPPDAPDLSAQEKEIELQWRSCCRYADIITENAKRDEYLIENITPFLVRKLRRHTPDLRRPTRMLLIMSQRSAAFLSLSVFRPKETLLLHSDRDKKMAEDLLQAFIRDRELRPAFWEGVAPPRCERVPADGFDTIRKHVTDFFADAPRAGYMVADVLGGTTGMKGSVLLGLGDSLSHVDIFYFGNQTSPQTNRHLAGTETILWLRRLDTEQARPVVEGLALHTSHKGRVAP